MSRAAVNSVLSNSIELQALGLLPSATYAANAVDTPPERPFIVMRWEENVRSFSDRGVQGLTVWVNDQLGDYTRIDQMIHIIKKLLTDMVHVAGDDGRTVTQIDWSGDSGDLWDDGYHTIARNAGFSVVSRPTG